MAEPGAGILVTGGAGFIGGRLAARLKAGGDPVVAVDRAEVDLSDRLAVERLMAELRPARVVHLAGSLDRRNHPDAVAAQWKDTFEAGRNVVLTAAAAGVEHLLVAGSIEELGSQGGALTPGLPVAPVTVYGLCKSLLREVTGFAAKTGGLRADWFRPFIVYGPGQRGPMVVPYAFESAARATPADFSDGVQERDFVFVDDIVEWLVEGVHADAAGGKGQLVVQHLGSQTAITVRQVLSLIAAEFPSSAFNIGAVPRRSWEPAVQLSGLNPGGQPWRWEPAVGIEDGIRRTAAWWRAEVSAGRSQG
ncbi:MAG TPA: NAD(P)-dependent oxidoreductase [Candidatus Dormibacteraeota bacterium]